VGSNHEIWLRKPLLESPLRRIPAIPVLLLNLETRSRYVAPPGRLPREKAGVENNIDTALAESPSPQVRRNSRRENEFIEAFPDTAMILAAGGLIAQLIMFRD
jgi:hypothetical protein